MDTNKSQENPLVIQSEQDALNVSIDNENIALNVIVAFIGLAQKRGTFNIQESAKIWECIQKFQKK
jgi:hypothetical protein